MSKGTSRGEYAALAVLELARAQKQKQTLSAGEIAERHNLSVRFMTATLQILKRHGLIRSVRGPLGGFELVPQPSEVALGYVLSLVAPPSSESRSASKVDDETPQQSRRSTRGTRVKKPNQSSLDRERIDREMKKAEEKRQEYLNGILYSDLIDNSAASNVLNYEI